MKKLFTAAAAFLAAACFMSCGGKKENIVKIGVYEPASGDNGAGGKQETLGVQYANQITPTVTIGGKEYKVQLEIVDNESSNDKAVTAASELISKGVSITSPAIDNIAIVLFPFETSIPTPYFIFLLLLFFLL